MRTKRRNQCRAIAGLVALNLCVVAPAMLSSQAGAPSTMRADDGPGFKQFSDRVQAYLTIHNAVEASLPALTPTDLPEMITAHQQALARKIREARPHAKAGDIFTHTAAESFRRASRAALAGPRTETSRAYMQAGAASPGMRLTVNGIYPDAEPITALSPVLLAAFPALPVEVAYRVVGQTLIVVDVKSRLIVDFARLIIPPAS
jgi:hypothetical protein